MKVINFTEQQLRRTKKTSDGLSPYINIWRSSTTCFYKFYHIVISFGNHVSLSLELPIKTGELGAKMANIGSKIKKTR